MGLTFAENTRPLCHNCWNVPFCPALLFALWLTACNNTCFTFTSNPPTDTVGIKAGDPKPTCTLTKANVAVRVEPRTDPECTSSSGSIRIQHIFLSILGLKFHPFPTEHDASPALPELLPSK